MKLYMVPLAPNPTKVMLYIAERAELGCEMGIEQVVVNTLKGRHKEPEHLARNPFGTLPVLQMDDGSHIVESLAIMEYLEDRFPDGALLGSDADTRAHNRDIERICDLRIALPIGAYVHATKSPIGYPPNAAKAEAAEASMQTPLDHIEALLSDGRPVLGGERPTSADCTLAAAFQFMRFIKADILGDRPNLRAWDTRYRARPAAAGVLKW